MLRLGAERDVLVAVQSDSHASLNALRSRFTGWIDDAAADQLVNTNPAFKVHLSTEGSARRGIRTMPHLRHGTEVLARSGDPLDVVNALASVLGGIHHRRRNDGRPWVNLRLFVRGSRAVLAFVERPHLVADRALHGFSVREVVNWGVELVDGERVQVPPPLSSQRSATGDRDAAAVERFDLAGVVLLDRTATSPATALSTFAVASADRRWFEVANRLTQVGLARAVENRRAAADAVQALLDGP